MTSFDGFGADVKDWFQGLEADNSREYFAAHRACFEERVRGQMSALLTELSETFGGEVKLFRPNRDIRFSADKSPYKTNTPRHRPARLSHRPSPGIKRADGLRFVKNTWQAAGPVTGWLDEHVGASAPPAQRRV